MTPDEATEILAGIKQRATDKAIDGLIEIGAHAEKLLERGRQCGPSEAEDYAMLIGAFLDTLVKLGCEMEGHRETIRDNMLYRLRFPSGSYAEGLLTKAEAEAKARLLSDDEITVSVVPFV